MCVQIGSLLVFSYPRFKYSHNQILTPCLLSSFQFHSSFDMTFSVPDFLVYLLSQFPDSANGVAAHAGRQEKKLAISWRDHRLSDRSTGQHLDRTRSYLQPIL